MADLFAQLTAGFERLSLKVHETNNRLGQQVHDLAAGLRSVNQKVDDVQQVTQARFEKLEARIASASSPRGPPGVAAALGGAACRLGPARP